MTREEAIEFLQYEIDECDPNTIDFFGYDEMLVESHKLAIKALKKDCDACFKDARENIAESVVECKLCREKQPEIVRCGECKYKEHCSQGMKFDSDTWDFALKHPITFCSHGERR